MQTSWLTFTVVTAAAAISYVAISRRWRHPISILNASKSRIARWADMWQKGRTNFHQHEPNPLLVKYGSQLLQANTTLRVFVPFCGKTVDLPWIASQSGVEEVIGNEAVELAVQQFVSVRSHKPAGWNLLLVYFYPPPPPPPDPLSPGENLSCCFISPREASTWETASGLHPLRCMIRHAGMIVA